MNEVVRLVLCHLVGDYVLQGDYIAKTKGENWYHLFVHSALYCLPFLIVYETTAFHFALFLSHMFIDSMKARYKKIGYVTDQSLHYLVLLIALLKVRF